MIPRFLKRWFGPGARGEPSRLTEAEALSIARRAAADDPRCADLGMVRREEREGRLVWVVASATVGSWLEVVVDDASGEAVDVRHQGVR